MFETELKAFNGRKEALVGVKRFKDEPVMLYRTNDLIHSQRVTWMLEDVLPELLANFENLDSERLLALSIVHDDPEIYTGDISSLEKENMTPEQRAQYNRETIEAIERLSRDSPYRLNGFCYRSLLLEAHAKETTEAQLMSWNDKNDGFCEAVHEVAAGNTHFLPIVIDYEERIRNLLNDFPILNVVVPGVHPFFQPLPEVEYEAFLERNPHTQESVLHPTGMIQYDRWRALTVSHGCLEDIARPKEHIIFR